MIVEKKTWCKFYNTLEQYKILGINFMVVDNVQHDDSSDDKDVSSDIENSKN